MIPEPPNVPVDHMTEPLSSDALRREQLSLAQRAFTNAQELVRFMDQKAAFLLAAVGIVTTALTTFGANVLRAHPNVPAYVLYPTVFLLICYVLLSVVLIWSATAVFAARSPFWTKAARKAQSKPGAPWRAPGFLFPLILLSKYSGDEDAYRRALETSTSGDLLAEYSNQILEVSRIYAAKQRTVNASLLLFQALIVFWLVDLLLLAIVSVY